MSDTPRQYKDCDGNDTSLNTLCRREPAWAANQIRHRDKLELELSDAKSHVTRLLAENARVERLANAGMAAETAAHNSEQKAERLERERDEARDKIAELWG